MIKVGSNGWGILSVVRDTTLTFLISTEAADLLRISKRTLERMRVDGTGPRYLKAGPGKRSRVLYRESDILAWLERRSFGSTSEYPAHR